MEGAPSPMYIFVLQVVAPLPKQSLSDTSLGAVAEANSVAHARSHGPKKLLRDASRDSYASSHTSSQSSSAAAPAQTPDEEAGSTDSNSTAADDESARKKRKHKLNFFKYSRGSKKKPEWWYWWPSVFLCPSTMLSLVCLSVQCSSWNGHWLGRFETFSAENLVAERVFVLSGTDIQVGIRYLREDPFKDAFSVLFFWHVPVFHQSEGDIFGTTCAYS